VKIHKIIVNIHIANVILALFSGNVNGFLSQDRGREGTGSLHTVNSEKWPILLHERVETSSLYTVNRENWLFLLHEMIENESFYAVKREDLLILLHGMIGNGSFHAVKN
jgi:hypothetical protein